MLERLVGRPEELEHKPGRRRTLRGVGGRRSAIIKLYAPERAATVAARTFAVCAVPPDPVSPAGALPRPWRLVVLAYVPGTPLRQALLAQDGATCARAGFALGSWNAFWRGPAPSALHRRLACRTDLHEDRTMVGPRIGLIDVDDAAIGPPELAATCSPTS